MLASLNIFWFTPKPNIYKWVFLQRLAMTLILKLDFENLLIISMMSFEDNER